MSSDITSTGVLKFCLSPLDGDPCKSGFRLSAVKNPHFSMQNRKNCFTIWHYLHHNTIQTNSKSGWEIAWA